MQPISFDYQMFSGFRVGARNDRYRPLGLKKDESVDGRDKIRYRYFTLSKQTADEP